MPELLMLFIGVATDGGIIQGCQKLFSSAIKLGLRFWRYNMVRFFVYSAKGTNSEIVSFQLLCFGRAVE
jgi:hypothetical protein